MNLCEISTVKRIMAKFSTGTKKSFGQNFLINEEIPYNIANESFLYQRSKEGKKSAVIEIGPGIGALTCELARVYDKVIAIEIDKTLIPVLEYTLEGYNNIKVINEDFLKIDLQSLLDEELCGYDVSVCANLPYYITTPIIMALLENARGESGASRLKSITVMVQKEVAQRLCADNKKSDYGAITASINYYAEVKHLFDVTGENFLPPPKVTSSVVRIELYPELKYKVENEKMLFDTIAGAFSQRRKTLLNSLSSYFSSYSKGEIEKAIENSGFDLQIRGERLSIEDFCKLSSELLKIKQDK